MEELEVLVIGLSFVGIWYYFFFSKRKNDLEVSKTVVSIFDTLYVIAEKFGGHDSREAYNLMIQKYRDNGGNFKTIDETTLFNVKRDAKYFIAKYFADNNSAMVLYRDSLVNIIEG